jgi:hypothetical protein
MTIAVQNALLAADRGVGTATLAFFRWLGGGRRNGYRGARHVLVYVVLTLPQSTLLELAAEQGGLSEAAR